MDLENVFLLFLKGKDFYNYFLTLIRDSFRSKSNITICEVFRNLKAGTNAQTGWNNVKIQIKKFQLLVPILFFFLRKKFTMFFALEISWVPVNL